MVVIIDIIIGLNYAQLWINFMLKLLPSNTILLFFFSLLLIIICVSMIASFEVACILCFNLYLLYYDHQDLFALLGQRLQSGTYLRCPTYIPTYLRAVCLVWSILVRFITAQAYSTVADPGPFYYCASVLYCGPSPRATKFITNFAWTKSTQNDSIGLISSNQI